MRPYIAYNLATPGKRDQSLGSRQDNSTKHGPIYLPLPPVGIKEIVPTMGAMVHPPYLRVRNATGSDLVINQLFEV